MFEDRYLERLFRRLDSCSVDAELEIDLAIAEAVLVDVAPVQHGCGEPRGVALGQAELAGTRLVDLQPINAGRRRATVVEVDQFWAEVRVFGKRLRQRVGESGDRVLVVTDDPEVYCLAGLWSVFTRAHADAKAVVLELLDHALPNTSPDARLGRRRLAHPVPAA